MKAQGSLTLDKLAMRVSHIKDVDNITEDTIQSSIDNFTLRVNGKKINPMMVGADGQTVHLATSEEVEEWSV